MSFVYYGLGLVTVVYLINKWENTTSKNHELQDEIQNLRHKVDMLYQFLCESKSLRPEIIEFKKIRHNIDHGILQSDHCECDFADTRIAIADNQDKFYEIFSKPLLEKWEMDSAGDRAGYDYTDEQLGTKLVAEVEPYFQKLHKLEPEKVTATHIQWLRDGKKKPRHLGCYFEWLLPSLEKEQRIFSKNSGFKSEEAKAVFNELKAKWKNYFKDGKEESTGESSAKP